MASARGQRGGGYCSSPPFAPSSCACGQPIYLHCQVWFGFVGLAYQVKDIVFKFVIEYSSFRDFGPLGNRSIFI